MVNRNLSSTAKIVHLMKNQNDQERKQRTHKLIQRGGLLNLSGLPQQCGIYEGEDLQNSPEGLESAAIILGILIDAAERLLHNNDLEKMEKFRKLGTVRLKQAAAKYY